MRSGRYDDVHGNIPGLINTVSGRLALDYSFLTGTSKCSAVTGLGS
jgi:hypothetical protein